MRHEPRYGTRRLFTYYRLDTAHAAETVATVGAMQQALRRRHPGLHAALLCRTDTASTTLMETYALDAEVAPQGVDVALQAAIEAEARRRLGDALAARRHVEVFDACA